MVNAEGLAEGCLSKVEVHKENLGILERHAGCDVHHCKCLTCCRIERSEHKYVRLVLLADHEVEVGSENSVCLVHHVAAACLYDDLGERLVVLLSTKFSELLESFTWENVARNLCEEWN